MKDPRPINLQTVDEVRQKGWVGQARDSDGHLCAMTDLSIDDMEISQWISEHIEAGNIVTFYPPTKKETA